MVVATMQLLDFRRPRQSATAPSPLTGAVEVVPQEEAQLLRALQDARAQAHVP